MRGRFLACQAFGRELLARGGGAIVNIASMSGNAIVNLPQRQCAYNSSKAGVSALTRSLAVEWGGRGRAGERSVSRVRRHPVQRPQVAHARAVERGQTVLGRFATPEEVAGAVVFLLSDESSYFVGAELLMDGGSSLR